MTIRSRLLLLLLPTLCAFLLLMSLFFYFNWSREILDSFKWRLQSVVVATAETVNAEEIDWIQAHLKDPDLTQNKKYIEYRDKLYQLKTKLPITHLYIVRIEPSDKDNGFKQVYLMDVSGDTITEGSLPGETDFSETEEHRVYLTKKAIVTPIYKAQKTGERFMSAYAPILNKQGNVMALLGADVSMEEIDLRLNRALLLILAGTLFTVMMILGSVFLIAERISKPVRQLNQAALDIAAGEYETDIHVKGPKEVVELANTLNTMSECLADTIHRLKESSMIRERLYGEHECTQLLQHFMLQKEAKTFSDPCWNLRMATTAATKDSHGLALRYNTMPSGDLEVALLESRDSGFASLVDLNRMSALPLTKLVDYNFVNCLFTKDEFLRYDIQNLFSPLVWSIKDEQWSVSVDNEVPLHPQDMVYMVNSALSDYFKTDEALRDWFGRVLRHFAKDGLDHIQAILNNEIHFLAKREGIKENLTIIMLQGKSK